jgi:hypothetical protein
VPEDVRSGSPLAARSARPGQRQPARRGVPELTAATASPPPGRGGRRKHGPAVGWGALKTGAVPGHGPARFGAEIAEIKSLIAIVESRAQLE